MERYIFNNILVHVSRTWERTRVKQPFEEMIMDNIESVDAIVEIADRIILDSVIQEFINTENRENWDWSDKTEEGCSDTYIERLAQEIIDKEYL